MATFAAKATCIKATAIVALCLCAYLAVFPLTPVRLKEPLIARKPNATIQHESCPKVILASLRHVGFLGSRQEIRYVVLDNKTVIYSKFRDGRSLQSVSLTAAEYDTLIYTLNAYNVSIIPDISRSYTATDAPYAAIYCNLSSLVTIKMSHDMEHSFGRSIDLAEGKYRFDSEEMRMYDLFRETKSDYLALRVMWDEIHISIADLLIDKQFTPVSGRILLSGPENECAWIVD